MTRLEDILKCYQTLGLAPGAGPKAVKKAYRDLVKRWHPDRFQPEAQKRPEAEEKIKEINLAFEKIQELQPSDLLMIRASQTVNHPPRTSASTQPKPKSKPQPRPAPAASPETVAAQPASPSASKSTAWLNRIGRTAQRILKPVPTAVSSAILLIGAAAVMIFTQRPPGNSGPPETAAKALSMADLDRMVASTRAAAPSSSGEVGPASANPSGVPNSSAVVVALIRSGSNGVGPSSFGLSASESLLLSGLRSSGLKEMLKSNSTENTPDRSPPTDPAAIEAEANFRLGLRYASGDDGYQDYAEAVKWYRAAAEAGHAGAQKNLGLLFAAGKGVPQDFVEAEKWLHQAAAQGQGGTEVASAIISLAKADAKRTAAGQPEIAESMTESSAKEEANTRYERGLRYVRGEGVTPDFVEAAKWFRLAAEAGHAGAQKNLGFLLAAGKGVAKDDAEAQKWFKKAAAQGQVGADFASALVGLKTSGLKTDAATNSAKEKLQAPAESSPEKK